MAAPNERKGGVTVIFLLLLLLFLGFLEQRNAMWLSKGLSVQTVPITSDQGPATLKPEVALALAALMKLSSPGRALETSLSERLTLLASVLCASCECGCTVTLTRCHPAVGLLHPVPWKNKVRRAETSVDDE